GKVMAEWITRGRPELDVWKMDFRRFGRHYRSRTYARDRASEVYATYYDIHYPGEERRAGRPLKMAPTYARLADLGAEFGEKAGWERPNWFATNEDERFEELRPRRCAWTPVATSSSPARPSATTTSRGSGGRQGRQMTWTCVTSRRAWPAWPCGGRGRGTSSPP